MFDERFSNSEEEYDCQCGAINTHPLIELILDPGSNQLSMSRLCLGVMTAFASIGGTYMLMNGAYTQVAAICTGAIASIAGVYFGSTRKQFRCNEGDK